MSVSSGVVCGAGLLPGERPLSSTLRMGKRGKQVVLYRYRRSVWEERSQSVSVALPV